MASALATAPSCHMRSLLDFTKSALLARYQIKRISNKYYKVGLFFEFMKVCIGVCSWKALTKTTILNVPKLTRSAFTWILGPGFLLCTRGLHLSSSRALRTPLWTHSRQPHSINARPAGVRRGTCQFLLPSPRCTLRSSKQREVYQYGSLPRDLREQCT